MRKPTNLKHGFNRDSGRHPIYSAWNAMIRRCNNPKNPAYRYYGGRGIRVCLEWLKFENFLRDMGSTWQKGLTLERIDNDGNYCFINCRWGTRREQMLNTRRTRMMSFGGQTMCLSDWAKKLKIVDSALRTRIALHGIESALTKPKYIHASH